MKAILAVTVVAHLVATPLGFCQGRVQFANRVPPPPGTNTVVDTPFYEVNGTLLAGTNYVVQLYAGKVVAGRGGPDSLIPVGEPVTFATNGYFYGGVVTIPGEIVGCNGSAWVQVRAWEVAAGTTFEASALAGGWTGISGVLFLATTGGPCGGVPIGPVPLFGLTYPGNPVIVRQPQDLRVRAGRGGSQSVTGSGGVALFYQWYQGESGSTDQTISGATNATFLTPLLATNATFWVKLSSSAGSTNSTTANVTVYPANAALLNLQEVAGLPGLVVDGSPGTSYRVQYKTNLNLAGWTDLVDLSLHTSPFTLIDSSASNSPARFYRVVAP